MRRVESHSGLPVLGPSASLPLLLRPSSSASTLRYPNYMNKRPLKYGALVPGTSVSRYHRPEASASLRALIPSGSVSEFSLPPPGFSLSRPKSTGGLKKLEVGRPPFKSWTRPDIVFDIIDADKGGTVSLTELRSFFKGTLDPGAIESLFTTLDEDGSGTVSRDEWVRGYAKAGFGQGTIVGQSAEGLGVLLDLVSHHYSVDFMDLTHGFQPQRIASVEERGITLRQLREVMAHVEARCGREGWTGLDGKRLSPATVTLYDVVRYVLKPCTQQGQCSYVERVCG